MQASRKPANFLNYCPGAARNGGIPIAMELLVDDAFAQNTDLAQLAISELHRFGVTMPDTKILFKKAEILDNGFPMPSVNNAHALRTIRSEINGMELDNLQMVGILSKENLFFQTDVLIDVFQKLNCHGNA